MSRVKIAVHVPIETADEVRKAIGEAGAGVIGRYTFCSFSVRGIGRFLPGNDANPYSGDRGVLNTADEERIEVTCDRADAKRVIAAVKSAHPYEEPTYDIYQLIDEDEL